MEEYSLRGQSVGDLGHEQASQVEVQVDNNNEGEMGDEIGSKASSTGGVINTIISNLVTPLKEGYFKELIKVQEEEQGNDEVNEKQEETKEGSSTAG
ncbi:hypothetical protein Syun_016148 [Stephania yunnanensis]|uniref:Uncharacterized protein n=1 Tax=Stephania yunnanensis TaxID=152371 RepID=A0AAP0J707_9MAGN